MADAQKPTGSEETFNIDAVPPEVTPEVTQTSSESDDVEKLQKKRKKKKKLKKMKEEGALTDAFELNISV